MYYSEIRSINILSREEIVENLKNVAPEIDPRQLIDGYELDINHLTGDLRFDIKNMEAPEGHPYYLFLKKIETGPRISEKSFKIRFQRAMREHGSWLEENKMTEDEFQKICWARRKLILACYGFKEMPYEN